MKALIVCENLIKYIKAKGTISGQVHSVFDNACNIETEDKFITLLTKNKIMAPMSMVIDTTKQGFKELNFMQNSKVNFSEIGIYCKDNNLLIEFDKASIWSPGVIKQCLGLPEEELLQNIKVLEAGISMYVKFYGIGPLISFLCKEMPDIGLRVPQSELKEDKSFQFIKLRFLDFIRDLVLGNLEAIEDRAEKVIGYGVGLTPAMDDFIGGIMISFIYLGSYYKLQTSQILEFNKKIISKGLNKTTKVSSEMLKFASIGQTNEAARTLINSILNKNSEDIIGALIDTIGYGETSGSDAVLGIYVGCKIMTNLKYRRVWVDEVMHRY